MNKSLSYALIFSSAILTAFSYQAFGPGIFFSLIPLLFTLRITGTSLFVWGTTTMAILHFFLIQLYTSSNILASLSLWLLASVVYGAFYGIGGFLFTKINKKYPLINYQWLPLIIVGVEWLKSIGQFGNTHGNLGFSLSDITPYIPAYSIIGWPGVTFLIVVVNICLYELIIKKQKLKNSLLIIGIGILLFAAKSPVNILNDTLKVSVIQTNIQQQQKMSRAYWPFISTHYLNSISNATGNIIILPETILPTIVSNHPLHQGLLNHVNKTRQALLFGSFVADNHHLYNSSIFLQKNQSPNIYHKQQLMPFGEYIPYRSLIRHLIPKKFQFNDLSIGYNQSPTLYNNFYIQPLICLEGIYGNLYTQSPSVNAVAILANNAWFNDSSAGHYLLKFAQTYAASIQRPVMLSANYGKSAIIDIDGSFLAHANHQNNEILTATIFKNKNRSLYSKYPLLGLLLLIIGYVIVILLPKNRTVAK